MPVEIQIQPISEAAKAAEAIVIPVYRGGDGHLHWRLPRPQLHALERLKKASGIDGELGSVAVISSDGGLFPPTVIFTGIASRSELTGPDIFEAYASGVRKAVAAECPSVALLVPDGVVNGAAQAAITGLFAGTYRFARKQKPLKHHLRRGVILTETSPTRSELDRLAAIGEAQNYAFEIVNRDGGELTPWHLAEEAKIVARATGAKATVWGMKEIQANGMGLLAAVGRASEHEPKFIRLDYTPAGPASGHLVVAGKGITFDTGGIDLKRYPGLPTMKGDMGGAAAVLGLFKTLPAIRPSVRITGLIPAAENAFGGASYKPGDVYKSMSGKHVEIGDTDAEGRLVLADVLHYAKELKPDAIIDLATLTGSCVVGLGELYAGLFSNSDRLVNQMLDASERAFERFWRLPLPTAYRRLIYSQIADLKNIASTKYGDAIMAALFLKEFVGDTPWAHLDIAGPSWVDDDTPGYLAMGTGYAVRTLCQLVEPLNWSRERLQG